MNEETVNDDSWRSYPKIFAIGHRGIAGIFDDEVVVEEKIDGSQFSFGSFGGELRIRSKGAVMHVDAPEKMFNEAAATVKELHAAGLLRDGWTYRAEYLRKPKHNTLCYDRVPAKHLIGFDVGTGNEHWLDYDAKKAEFERLGLETVPLVFRGKIETVEVFRSFLERTSVLGSQLVEGVVVKNHAKLNPFGQVMIGKFVSEDFKEVHTGEWKQANPGKKDVIESLILAYKSPARWNKAIQHLREAGKLEGSPKDIGLLVREVPIDIRSEHEDEIKQALFEWAWPNIQRGSIAGLAQYYKETLMKSAFEDEPTDAGVTQLVEC